MNLQSVNNTPRAVLRSFATSRNVPSVQGEDRFVARPNSGRERSDEPIRLELITWPLPVPRALRMLAVAVVLATALTGLRATSPVDAKPIEGYPDYQPQTGCSPRPKPGTVMLSEHLLRKCCWAPARSESPGRARGRVSPSTRRAARSTGPSTHAPAATGATHATSQPHPVHGPVGNRNALARRMGIMYVIWNDHIWSASTSYRRRDYLHGSCKKLRELLGHAAPPRPHAQPAELAAARAETSWYVKRSTPKPAPEPTATPEPAPEPDTSRDEKADSGRRSAARSFPTASWTFAASPTERSVPVDGGTVETRFKPGRASPTR